LAASTALVGKSSYSSSLLSSSASHSLPAFYSSSLILNDSLTSKEEHKKTSSSLGAPSSPSFSPSMDSDQHQDPSPLHSAASSLETRLLISEGKLNLNKRDASRGKVN
jgi:hypothetical protein